MNFFANLEEGKQAEGVANKEHELEKKKEQEDYEKQIGLLTYLGQGSRESTGESAWYEKPSLLKTLKNQTREDISYKDERAKDMFDPLRVIRHYIGKPETIKPKQSNKIALPDLRFPAAKPESVSSRPEKRHKKKKRKSEKDEKKTKKNKKDKSKRRSSEEDQPRRKRRKTSEKADDVSTSNSSDFSDSDAEKKQRLAVLRAKRLQREKTERSKANKLLATVNGVVAASSKEKSNQLSTDSESDERPVKVKPKQKYHSQYNPDMARQNQPLDSGTKYWLQ